MYVGNLSCIGDMLQTHMLLVTAVHISINLSAVTRFNHINEFCRFIDVPFDDTLASRH
jgi:hypothetical protein